VAESRRSLAEHIACIGEMRNVCNIVVWKPEGKKPGHRWKDDIALNSIKHSNESFGSIKGRQFMSI
jgi:hypothetical protein